MFRKIFFFITIFAAIFVFSGCGSKMKLATPEETKISKQFNPPPAGHSGLYMYRYTPLNVGLAINRSLFIDDTPIATLRQNQYLYMLISPGVHTISVESNLEIMT